MTQVHATRIVTAAEMREIDILAVKEFGLSVREMMEAAGRALAAAVAENEEADNIFFVCGHGNNGGDGMAAARFLFDMGRRVTVMLTSDPEGLQGEPLEQFRMLCEVSVQITWPGNKHWKDSLEELEDCEVIVDALLGTGARLPLSGVMKELVQTINSSSALVISADIPTGISCDTGEAIGAYVIADRTVAFGLAKPFLFAGDGLVASGAWEVADIGLPLELTMAAGSAVMVDDLSGLHRLPRRPLNAHKRSSGVVLVVAGSASYPGAPTLTALGAYRAGAGLVTVATVSHCAMGLQSFLPECPIEVLPDVTGFISPDAAERVIELAARCDCVVIGPGLGRAPAVGAFLNRLFGSLEAQWVVDADALWWLPELTHRPSSPALLTPHEGEAARLLGCQPADVTADRFTTIRKIAEKYSHQVLLKGPCTLIHEPGVETAVNRTGCAILATAGSGDVLAGVAGAYLAILGEPFSAGVAAAYIHGAAGDLLSREFDGGMGALAREIAEIIPEARIDRLENLVSSFGEEDEPEDWDEEWDDELDDESDESEFGKGLN